MVLLRLSHAGVPERSKGQGLGVFKGLDNMNKLSKIAKNNKNIAMAIINQAIIDEGAIGADGTITITYTSMENATYLWNIAHAWDLVHPLRTKIYPNHTKWCISFKAENRKDIYDYIGVLPDPRQDKMFRHILRRYTGGSHKGKRGETRNNVLELLKNKDMTVRDISYSFDISASTVRTHLRQLRDDNKVLVRGFNTKSPYKNQKTAEIWSLSKS